MKQLDSARKKVGQGKITRETFRNEDGAIDLASIMVGIIVIGLIGGVIAATVFAVIPWSQDNAAKQQLNSIVQAENAYMGLSSAIPSPLASGYTPNSYADSPGLAKANLLTTGPAYCAVTINSGKGFQGFSASASGSIWMVTDTNTSPTSFTGTLPSACSGITAASSTTATTVPSSTATWTKNTTALPGPIVATSGSFATQLASVSSSPEYISTNSGSSWAATTGTVSNGYASAASSQNGTYLLMGRTLGVSSSGSGYAYFSANGGTSWSQLTALGTPYISQAWVSNDGQKIVAAVGGGGANYYVKKSTDGGATFTVATTVSSSSSSYSSWSGLAVSSDGSHMYVLEANTFTKQPILHLSTDGGSTWTTANVPGNGISTDSTGKYVVMGNTAANGTVLVSNNYGSSFSSVQVGTATNQTRSVTQQAVSSDGQSMTVTGNDGSGVLVFVSRDAGQTWTAQSGVSESSLSSEISTDGSSFLAWNGATVYNGK